MNNNKDPMDQIITEDLLREAEAIDEEIEAAGVESMPQDLKEKLKQRLHEQIEDTEKERVYAQLSDEDKKALELGRRMLKESEDAEGDGKVVYRRKKRKVFLAVAAVAVLVLAMGITSIGGTERVIEMMKVMIEGREVVRVDTEEDNYVVTEEKEEAAYQEIKDVFGVEAVKLVHWPDKVRFVAADIDKEMQTALLSYEYRNNSVNYFISSHHTDSSWGIDVENEVTDHYCIELEKAIAEVHEYETPELKQKMYSAKYNYNGIEYFLIGIIEKEDFEFLLKNLNFFY